MLTRTYAQYITEKAEFMHKNNKSKMKVYTSPMENDTYHKEYCFENGAQWCEVCSIVTEMAEANIHGITMTVEVELFRTEYWSTADSRSKYMYERV